MAAMAMACGELPPYPQLILEAIDSLDLPGGADKSSISEYIGSRYVELNIENVQAVATYRTIMIDSEHEQLLTTHLTQMKDSGELLLVDNKYLKPIPPKRGRGRPPKPKDTNASDQATASPRPRGRPPSAKKAKASGEASGRPRGRPRKVKPVVNGVEA